MFNIVANTDCSMLIDFYFDDGPNDGIYFAMLCGVNITWMVDGS